MNYTAIVIDDEKKALDRLERVMLDESRVSLAGKFTNPFEALSFAERVKIDLVFLDIDMPNLDGLALAEKLRASQPRIEIIFVTAYAQHALSAFRLHAAGYLLKPIGLDELREQIDVLDTRLGEALIRPDQTVRLHVCCFGHFRCYPEGFDDRPIPWRTGKSEELFAFLISHSGAPVHKDLIIDALWPDADPDKAANRFRVTCTYLRNTLAASGFPNMLLRERDSYSLDLGRITCDLIRFNFVQKNLSNSRDVRFLEQTARLIAAQFLKNKTYEWADQLRRLFELTCKTTFFHLADLHLADGRHEPAAAALEAVLARDPCDEQAATRLISLRLQTGESESAVKTYLTYEKSLADQLGLQPSAGLRKLIGKEPSR